MSVRVRIEGDAPAEAPSVPAEVVEAACSGRTLETARWIRQHPEWIADNRKFAKLQSAHFDAQSEGLRPDTPEYFSHVERRLGIGDARPANFNRADPNTHVWDDGKRVVLTRGEEKAATETLTWTHGPKKGQPLGVEEYARRKREMVRDGRYTKLG